MGLRPSKVPITPVGPLIVVMLEPLIQINLEFVNGGIKRRPESLPKKLVQDGPVEPFHEAVGPGPSNLRSPMLNVMRLQKEFGSFLTEIHRKGVAIG
jgi:hypothetical protein